jgi:alanyl-tRNA synthetase
MGGQIGDTGLIQSQDATIKIVDTQVTAGYFLHVCQNSRDKLEVLTVGDSVTLERNAPRRNAIERNHTATHLLNHALRDILGPNVNQKGSLVAPDRLRFDFSHNSPLTHPELVRTNEHISRVVEQDVQVYAQSAPLDSARTIAGLRAVFGETYPDPVRIVSVGVPISDLLSDPSCERWNDHSVEFCGGTHVATTGKIQQTALIEEEAVAKGVRRIVMLTGNAAREALECGQQLTARAQEASQLDAEALTDEVPAILSELEHRTVPLADAHEVRRLLDSLREKLKAAKKESAKAGRGEAVDAARALAESATGDVIVGQIPAGGDRQALLAAMDCVRARHEGAAIMLASVDDEAGKVALVASCSKDAIGKGLKAGDWVREVSAVLGGKGGGRPDSAQGSGTMISKLSDAMERAQSFAHAQLC